MVQNREMMKRIDSFFSALVSAYRQQGQIGKLILPGSLVLIFCCLCSTLVSLFRPRNSPTILTSPVIFPTQGNVATPTALFNFGSPFPTLVVPSAVPTTPSQPTNTLPPSTATVTSTATLTPTATNVPATATSFVSVLIVAVDKPREYVDIQN